MSILGIDTGGTFTDFVHLANGRVRIHKTLSTPDAPERAILQGIEDLDLATEEIENLVVVHGTTVATNATLEGKGAKTLFVTNRGFKDSLLIGRQARKELYNLRPQASLQPFQDTVFVEIDFRQHADGTADKPLCLDDLNDKIRDLDCDSAAVCLLFSYLNEQPEKQIASHLNTADSHLFISRSSDILPIQNEYERGIATWLNARLGPLVHRYLTTLGNNIRAASLGIMQSSGGTIDVQQAGKRPVNLLLSGPAGGLAATGFVAKQLGIENLMTFDMGGTSTDVALFQGEPSLTSEGQVGGYPVAIPMIDIHTIGAGGGSIAFADDGNLLRVGPRSAGAAPGPACYGKGGIEPTVTDANLALGRLRSDRFLGGRMTLNIEAARSALDQLGNKLGLSTEDTARGIIRIANEHMVQALRHISVERGHNPSEFTLCCFGGAGGLHVCELADQLNISTAIIPFGGGVFSALGMIAAPRERQLTRTLPGKLADLSDDEIERQFDELIRLGTAELIDEGIAAENIQVQRSADMRYCGQSFTLNVPWESIESARAGFQTAHKERFGHSLDIEVELHNLRCRIYADGAELTLPRLTTTHSAPSSQVTTDAGKTAVYERGELAANQLITGPALICEEVSTTFVAAGWQCSPDYQGHLILKKTSD